MAKGVMSRSLFTAEVSRSRAESAKRGESSATERAEKQVMKTGKLNPLVDPAGFGVIRRSLIRFDEQSDGTWKVAVGTPIPIEERLDTTGSMGHNVDIALEVLPLAFDLCASVLPGYDPQMAIGIFGDVQDHFSDGSPAPVICRPQFEMDAPKIVEQLQLQVPMRDGGDRAEDPQLGLFGATYLTAAYINRIGLCGYDFTASDAPARDRLDESQLIRVYGPEVFAKVVENGYRFKKNDLPSTKEMVREFLTRSHAFFLQVGEAPDTTRFWTNVFGEDRIVVLPNTKLMPQVMAAIIGLTEGSLDLQTVQEFLQKNNVSKENAKLILRSVANIPIGAQAALSNFAKKPKKGDIFANKTDVWPIGASEDDKGHTHKPGKAKPSKKEKPNMWQL